MQGLLGEPGYHGLPLVRLQEQRYPQAIPTVL